MTQRQTHRASELVTNASEGGLSLISFKVTSVGTPDHITFKSLNLPNMANADYRVLVQGETASVCHVDESTIATTGFDVLHGVGGEILHIWVHGKQASAPQV